MPVEVKQIYTNCLAEAAYFIVSEGEAAVIDPLRDPAPYLKLAEEHKAKIKYVIETHFHADFVSGHVDLAKATGATIVYGPTAEPNFDALIARDDEELPLGDATIRVLHTPGHTMESSCFLLLDKEGTPKCVFTGDTLFLGDAGRPDLAQKAAKMTQEDLARLLYKSLRTKLMPLPDDVIVYPGHGAGSACGKNMSKDTFDTLGRQKLTNYTLRADMTEDEFVTELLDGLRAPPAYFGHEVALNKGAAAMDPFQDVITRGMRKLTVEDVKKHIADDVLVLDTRRDPTEYCSCHIPRTVFAGVGGSLAIWVATVFKDVKQPFVVIGDEDSIKEGIERLSRVGFDNCLGHLDGGIAAWKAAGEPCGSFPTIEATEFFDHIKNEPESVQLLDVRGPGEHINARVEYAMNVPLCSREPIDFEAFLHPDKVTYVHCMTGYRSVMFLSIALRLGVKARVANVKGGWKEMEHIARANSKIVERKCPKQLAAEEEARKKAAAIA